MTYGKIYFIFLLLSFSLNYYSCKFLNVKTIELNYKNTSSIIELAKRVIPNHYQNFSFKLNTTETINNTSLYDTFTLYSESNKIVVESDTINGLTSGLYYYLKFFCKVQYSWMNHNLNMPNILPRIEGEIIKSSKVKYRYYMNVCTVSYSMVWWDWERWQKELDWMALNGINFALAFTGQEYIWEDVFYNLGLNKTEILDFIAGPAFLAWGRMGNIQAWAGPFTDSFKEGQFKLQLQILKRMKELGIIPVLPAFNGFVPKALKIYFPKIDVRSLSPWNGFNQTFSGLDLLDPKDSMFETIQSLFISTQNKLYDNIVTSHFYNTDTFNENNPPSGDLDYLKALSRTVYNTMKKADNNAVWVMQGWLFYCDSTFWKQDRIKALLDGVPDDSMIILDLYAENHPVWKLTDSFYGKPYIWCTLHNFGGRTGLHGNLNNIVDGINDAVKNSKNMIGVGLTMEGINQNYINYELTLEMPWNEITTNEQDKNSIKYWVKEYINRRYGNYNENIGSIWELIRKTIYNCTTGQSGPTQSKVSSIPEINMDNVFYYDKDVLLEAITVFEEQRNFIGNNKNYEFDLTDFYKDYFNILFTEQHNQLIFEWKNKDLNNYKKSKELMINYLGLIEFKLQNSTLLNLDNWINSAENWATNESEKKSFNYNARLQISVWGQRGSGLSDYACKMWKGLVQTYYAKRWDIFFNELDKGFNTTTFDEESYKKNLFDFEQEWQYYKN